MQQDKKDDRIARLHNDPDLIFPDFQSSPVDGTAPRRENINWKLVGCYDTLEDLAALVRANKVSRRKTDELQTGTKTTFRCNSWKRTRCSFQMYSLMPPGDRIYVYEAGQHDHTGLRIPHIATMQTPTANDFADLMMGLKKPKLDPDFQTNESELASASIKQETSDAPAAHIGEDPTFSSNLNNYHQEFVVGQQEPGSFNISDLLNDSPVEPLLLPARECQPDVLLPAEVHQQK